MVKLIVLLALLMIGCGERRLTMPGQDTVVDMVWKGVFGRSDRPPILYWVTGEGLTCHEGRGFWLHQDRKGAYIPLCAAGVFWPDIYSIEVAWKPKNTHFHSTAIAHELNHGALFKEGGQFGADSDHLDPSWGAEYGYPYSRLDEAERLLRLLNY